MRIDCSSCDGPSLPSDPSCIRCICFLLMDNMATERVMVRQYDDRAISGDAVSVLRDFAHCLSVIRSIDVPKRWRCAKCPASPKLVMQAAWKAFPDMPATPTPVTEGKGCRVCLERIRNALDRSRMMHGAVVKRTGYLAFERRR